MKTLRQRAAEACPICRGINEPESCAFHAQIEEAMVELQKIFMMQLLVLKAESENLIRSIEGQKNSQ